MAKKQPQISIDMFFQPKGIVLISLLAFWFMFTKEKIQIKQLQVARNELKILQDNLKIKEAQLKIAKEEIKKIEEYEKGKEFQAERISEIQKKLLSSKDTSRILNFLTSGPVASGLTFNLLKTDTMLEHETFWELPITVQLNCDYLTLGRYISGIEETTKLIEFKSLKLHKLSTEENNLSVDMEAVAYLAK